MNNRKLSSKLDILNRYWHIPADEESSKLLTFNSPYGRLSFIRLPYGTHSASEVFHVQVAKIIEGINTPHMPVHDEISVVKRLVLKDTRIIVSNS